jgi:hypothetical protein
MPHQSLSHAGRAALAAAGLAIAMSLAALTGSAAAQTTIAPNSLVLEPDPVPIVQPIVTPCSQIASFSPATARPGQDVDIFIRPPSGRSFFGYTVTGVQFANGVPATFTNVATHQVRAKVPVGASTGSLRVTCRSAVINSTWSINSATSFTPISFGSTLNPSPTTINVNSNRTITATLSHPAPEPMTLTLAPQSNHLSVQGLAAGTPGSVTIPTGQQSATFTVAAHAAAPAGASILVSGPSVVGSTLTVTIPTPGFTLSVPDPDEEVHWGDEATYTVQVSSDNGFAGTVTLSDSAANPLPFGATAAPVSVAVPAGGSANATLTVETDQSATKLGPNSFRVRGRSPGVADRTSPLNLRVLPDEGGFGSLTWHTASSSCNGRSATVTGTNVTFSGAGFANQSHTHVRHAWTPDCRGAVVLGTATMANGGSPMSIFNFGFADEIADAPGSRLNMGAAAWNTDHVKVSPDGSYLIGVAQSMTMNANLYNMLDLAHRPPADSYTIAETLSASVVGDEIQAQPSGNSNDWTWTLP